jgi:hypothetical protein
MNILWPYLLLPLLVYNINFYLFIFLRSCFQHLNMIVLVCVLDRERISHEIQCHHILALISRVYEMILQFSYFLFVLLQIRYASFIYFIYLFIFYIKKKKIIVFFWMFYCVISWVHLNLNQYCSFDICSVPLRTVTE